MTGWYWLLVLIVATAAVYAAFVGGLVIAGRRDDARAFVRFIPDSTVLIHRIIGDRRVPRRSKLLMGALVAYLAMPFDVVPDFIPIAGQFDDAIVIALVLRTVLRSAGKELLEEHWPGPRASLDVLVRLAYGAAA
ncbi:MAG TPA: DUF1232 domain-containing protein [Solirubrobacter sp.]|nr:DUF1232 domain-containing protein [Solirubrobacter sp.]